MNILIANQEDSTYLFIPCWSSTSASSSSSTSFSSSSSSTSSSFCSPLVPPPSLLPPPLPPPPSFLPPPLPPPSSCSCSFSLGKRTFSYTSSSWFSSFKLIFNMIVSSSQVPMGVMGVLEGEVPDLNSPRNESIPVIKA